MIKAKTTLFPISPIELYRVEQYTLFRLNFLTSGNDKMVQKLTNMEAQRVINCMDDSLQRLRFLADVPAGNPDPDILAALSEDGKPQLRAALAAQWQAEENYLMARAALERQGHGRHHHHHHHGHHGHHKPQVSVIF